MYEKVSCSRCYRAFVVLPCGRQTLSFFSMNPLGTPKKSYCLFLIVPTELWACCTRISSFFLFSFKVREWINMLSYLRYHQYVGSKRPQGQPKNTCSLEVTIKFFFEFQATFFLELDIYKCII